MDRKSFIIYLDSLEILDELTDEEAGKLFKAIKLYQSEGKIELKGVLKALFISFKNTFDRDAEKYKSIVNRNKQNGKSGGRPKKEEIKTQNNPVGFSGLKNEEIKTQNNMIIDSDSDSENDTSTCFLSPLDESAHEKNATERRNKKEVTEDKAEQNKGLQGITPIRTQKVDPYYSEEVKRFKSCYKAHFGAIPFLSSPQCLQLSELIEQTPDFFETLDDVLKTLKSIGEFTGKDGKKYKPSVSFLLKDKNYSDLRNGVYDNRAAPDEDFYNTTFMAALREVREQE